MAKTESTEAAKAAYGRLVIEKLEEVLGKVESFKADAYQAVERVREGIAKDKALAEIELYVGEVQHAIVGMVANVEPDTNVAHKYFTQYAISHELLRADR